MIVIVFYFKKITEIMTKSVNCLWKHRLRLWAHHDHIKVFFKVRGLLGSYWGTKQEFKQNKTKQKNREWMRSDHHLNREWTLCSRCPLHVAHKSSLIAVNTSCVLAVSATVRQWNYSCFQRRKHSLHLLAVSPANTKPYLQPAAGEQWKK